MGSDSEVPMNASELTNRLMQNDVEKTEATYIASLPNAYKTATASFFSAVIVCGLLHPLDLIKTRMQVAHVSSGAIPRYGSTPSAIQLIYANERLKGLYKGVNATMIASGISWGIFRYFFDITRNVYTTHNIHSELTKQRQDMSYHYSLQCNMIAGLFAGVVSTVLVHPLWLIKTRLEMQALETKAAHWFQYKGWGHCLVSMYKANGISGLYRGLGPALALVPHAALQTFLYEELKHRDLKKETDTVPSQRSFLFNELSLRHIYSIVPISCRPFIWGAASKCIAVSATYPLQVLRSRQQMLHAAIPHQNVFQLVANMIQSEGLRSLYSGFGTHIQRACIYNGMMFFLFEKILSFQH